MRNSAKEKTDSNTAAKRVAKRDFVLCFNEYFFDIKSGDDLDALGVPHMFNMNLRTEKVI